MERKRWTNEGVERRQNKEINGLREKRWRKREVTERERDEW